MKWKFNIWSLLFILILIYFIFVLREDIQRFKSLSFEKKDLTKKIAQEEKSHKELEARLKKLDSEGLITDLSRQRLNLIREGEKAYKVCRRK